MEITESLNNDLKTAPNWFHKAISEKPRIETLTQSLGNLRYQVWDKENSKNIILLVHGTGAHKKWWDPIAPLINDNCSVIAPDLPGMGESEHRSEYSFEAFGEAIIAILNHEKAMEKNKQVYLIGHSLGGHLAGYIASEMPDFPAGLIMIDSPIRPPTYDYDKHESTGPLRKIKYYEDKLSILKRFRLMPPQECKNDWFIRYIAEYSIRQEDQSWRWRFDDKLFTTLKRLHNYEFKFKCPSVFIAGGNSLLLGSKIMKYIKEAFKDSMSFEVIDGAAHHVPLDSPLELASIINKYLKNWS